MAKVIFEGFPCALAKILGAFVVSVGTPSLAPKNKYILLLENLNLGIKPVDEKDIVRYDLKGSELNRFVTLKEGGSNELSPIGVMLDSNFLHNLRGRPYSINKAQANLMHISLHNDSLTLQNDNIIDYSMLVIINNRTKTIRIGIIDYL
jgi:hypothetical protein